MNFLFGDEQRLFQRSVRDVLEKESAPGRDGPGVWSALAELGVLGMLVPEELGGQGKDETDIVLALEEAGRAALLEPVVETAVIGPAMVLRAGPSFAAEWLGPVAGGEVTVDRDRYDGSWFVRRVSGGSAITVPASATPDAIDLAFDRGAFGTAAVLCGIADRVIEMAATYAKQRHQFGKPIGSFQAVKHLLADALLRLEFARPAVCRAAWSLARESPDARRDVSMAKALASDAAVEACRSALQVHGAIGYTHEHELHRWLNAGFPLAHAWGTAAAHRDRVARAVLG